MTALFDEKFKFANKITANVGNHFTYTTIGKYCIFVEEGYALYLCGIRSLSFAFVKPFDPLKLERLDTSSLELGVRHACPLLILYFILTLVCMPMCG